MTSKILREVEDGVYAYGAEPANILDDFDAFRYIVEMNEGIEELTADDVDADDWATYLAQLDFTEADDVRKIYRVKDSNGQHMIFADIRDYDIN